MSKKDRRTQSVSIGRFKAGKLQQASDRLVTEEPLEIQIRFGKLNARQRKSIAITMRTPGDDEVLALGFLFTEGIIRHPEEILDVRSAGQLSAQESNYVIVDLHPNIQPDLERLNRHFYTTSSCGVCGKTSIESLQTVIHYDRSPTLPHISAEKLIQFPDILRQAQEVFGHTGGIHAAGLFDFEGNLLIIKEDVGRHNALDKVIGTAFRQKLLPLHQHIILVSGRTSFELVQKTLMAGVPILAAVGSPSSLAVKLADEYDMILIGFLRDSRFNIYSGIEKLNITSLNGS